MPPGTRVTNWLVQAVDLRPLKGSDSERIAVSFKDIEAVPFAMTNFLNEIPMSWHSLDVLPSGQAFLGQT